MATHTRTTRWRAAVLAGALGLTGLAMAGCASPTRDAALRAPTALVGMPRERLLACAGVPERQAGEGEREFFSYSARSSGTGGFSGLGLGVGGGGGSHGGGVGIGLGLGLPLFGGYGVDECRATVTLRGGVVESIAWSAGSDLATCGAIVAACVPPPRQP
jgi:hypothetical protein